VAWLLHDAPGYEAFRARALAGDPGWPDCDRVLADHLVALYRFADALPFFAAALQQAPDDVPSMLGMAKAMIYTGDGARAKELLERSKAVAGGTVDAWRNNALAAQQLLDADYDTATIDGFVVQMHRGDIDVLRAYLLPIQLEAAEVLGRKYGYRPEVPTKVEVFQTWDDFSVRTIGFRGFTALGACFGRLITLVSPVDGDLRQQDFMWEATAWHEYTHVLTLGLSQHRVPRWLTEGFSVYEERARDPSWERGMDRELFDAVANQDIAPVHLLNRLFRGPRILFGYYQGGLIVEWITQHHGFAKALELLKAFAEDLDTEEAFERALGIPSRSFDRQFLAWVQAEKLRGMRLVARLDDAAIDRAALRAAQDRSAVQPRLDLAWAFVQRDNPVDAGRWLGEVLRIDPEHAQA
jgi:thioredoxin-like negative regulator of GroEL